MQQVKEEGEIRSSNDQGEEEKQVAAQVGADHL